MTSAISRLAGSWIIKEVQEAVVMAQVCTFDNYVLHQRVNYLSRNFILGHREPKHSKNDLKQLSKVLQP